MTTKRTAVACLLAAALVACVKPKPSPKPVPFDDVSCAPFGDISKAPTECQCAAMCARLLKLQCGEVADAKECTEVCIRVQLSGKMDLKPVCVAKSITRDDATMCGTVDCM